MHSDETETRLSIQISLAREALSEASSGFAPSSLPRCKPAVGFKLLRVFKVVLGVSNGNLLSTDLPAVMVQRGLPCARLLAVWKERICHPFPSPLAMDSYHLPTTTCPLRRWHFLSNCLTPDLHKLSQPTTSEKLSLPPCPLLPVPCQEKSLRFNPPPPEHLKIRH